MQEATDLQVLCDLMDETLEGELVDEELRRLLVPTDVMEGDRTGAEPLLHRLCSIACQLLHKGESEDIRCELSFWLQRIWR